ncbi:hypothetical protein DFH09DRAFT_1164552 [Mycena vulgaris]|nr:hypothetical protein DFH09DRAFT_1164552 [Mycena vulgaris]
MSTSASPSTTAPPAVSMCRVLRIAAELFFSFAASSLLIFALLPCFGLHDAPPRLVFRVTGVVTLVVFAALEALGGLGAGVRRDNSDCAPVENPAFKLTPRVRERERDVEAGWAREKAGM